MIAEACAPIEQPEAPPAAAVERARRKSKTSPTQRTLKHMREQGYLCQVVERWNPHARVKQDLYGFIDVLCVKGEDIVGVQACSSGGSSGRGSDMSARITKITEHANWPLVCSAIRVVVQGWRKNAQGHWVLREVQL